MLDQMMLDALGRSTVPLSAYDLMAKLGEDGRRFVPASIYRSLERLCERGAIEKVYMLSAFRLKDVGSSVLMICIDCGRAESLALPDLHAAIGTGTAQAGFNLLDLAVEAAGRCADCSSSRAC